MEKAALHRAGSLHEQVVEERNKPHSVPECQMQGHSWMTTLKRNPKLLSLQQNAAICIIQMYSRSFEKLYVRQQSAFVKLYQYPPFFVLAFCSTEM